MKKKKQEEPERPEILKPMTTIESADLFNKMFWHEREKPHLFGPFEFNSPGGKLLSYRWAWKICNRVGTKTTEREFFLSVTETEQPGFVKLIEARSSEARRQLMEDFNR